MRLIFRKEGRADSNGFGIWILGFGIFEWYRYGVIRKVVT